MPQAERVRKIYRPRALRSARRAIGWATVATFLAITGCAHRSVVPVTPNDLVRFAPPPAGMEEIWLTGSASGRLAYRNGCFRLVRRDDFTILWPHSYVAVVRSDGRRGVMDGGGNTAFDGDYVTLGGGGGSEEAPVHVLHRETAIACGGPYSSGWLPF